MEHLRVIYLERQIKDPFTGILFTLRKNSTKLVAGVEPSSTCLLYL